ncbi:MAG: 6,7-dimethyl-8-ribityllumazine synthase [Pseudobdellovibrionaceae bacterium]
MKKIIIIQGTFHTKEMPVMLEAALAKAKELELHVERVVSVPGSMEIPLALHRALHRPDIDGAVLLGIIERGETKHGMVMGHTVIQSVIDQQVATNKPVGVGILGPEILPSQIPARLMGYAQAAVAAVDKMLKIEI